MMVPTLILLLVALFAIGGWTGIRSWIGHARPSAPTGGEVVNGHVEAVDVRVEVPTQHIATSTGTEITHFRGAVPDRGNVWVVRSSSGRITAVKSRPTLLRQASSVVAALGVVCAVAALVVLRQLGPAVRHVSTHPLICVRARLGDPPRHTLHHLPILFGIFGSWIGRLVSLPQHEFWLTALAAVVGCAVGAALGNALLEAQGSPGLVIDGPFGPATIDQGNIPHVVRADGWAFVPNVSVPRGLLLTTGRLVRLHWR